MTTFLHSLSAAIGLGLLDADFDRAAEAFEVAIEARYPVIAHHISWLGVDEAFGQSPQYRRLREKMNLT